MKHQEEKIHLGLVLAGAVTAGAFTAGVLDYLINTLQLWEEEYSKNPEGTPKPNVVIDVLTGASAGSIAAAVTTLGLATDSLKIVSDPYSEKAKENILFDTWVNFGLKENESILDKILSLEDLKDEKPKSLLNTSFIENLVLQLIEKTNTSKLVELPPYINPNLEVLMTLSNLRGIPIDLYFSSDRKKVAHTMSYHKAYASFQYGKNQNYSNQSDKLPLDINNDNHLKLFLNCARASGAFPIGLKSVPFNKIPKSYIEANIKRLFGDEINLHPRIGDEYAFLAVDGGMTNNEPIAEALKSLKEKGTNYKLILIDPFPNHIKENDNFDATKDSIFDVIPQLYKTLRNQTLFKESDIIALFKDGTDKNMIWPTRYGKDRNKLPNAIASGAIAGFSGFLNREFRIHDYMLGQKNAQNFLRYYFITEKTENWSEEMIHKFGLIDKKTGTVKVPIIPDFSIKEREKGKYGVDFFPNIESENKLPIFPSVAYDPLILNLEKKLKERVQRIVKNSFQEFRNLEKSKKEEHPLIVKRSEKLFFNGSRTWLRKKAGNLFMNIIGINLITKTITKKAIDTLITELSNYELLANDPKNKNNFMKPSQ